jgi:hypothetical protein
LKYAPQNYNANQHQPKHLEYAPSNSLNTPQNYSENTKQSKRANETQQHFNIIKFNYIEVLLCFICSFALFCVFTIILWCVQTIAWCIFQVFGLVLVCIIILWCIFQVLFCLVWCVGVLGFAFFLSCFPLHYNFVVNTPNPSELWFVCIAIIFVWSVFALQICVIYVYILYSRII